MSRWPNLRGGKCLGGNAFISGVAQYLGDQMSGRSFVRVAISCGKSVWSNV